VTDTDTAARRYGDHYTNTASSYLAEIAALIMADLITISADPDPDSVFPRWVHYAADVYPRHDTIHISVYGFADVELAHPYDHPADRSPAPIDYPEIVDTFATRYGWTSGDPNDRRFVLHVTTHPGTDRDEQDEDRIGTVTTHPHIVPPWLLP
jgi:hypothetical protein